MGKRDFRYQMLRRTIYWWQWKIKKPPESLHASQVSWTLGRSQCACELWWVRDTQMYCKIDECSVTGVREGKVLNMVWKLYWMSVAPKTGNFLFAKEYLPPVELLEGLFCIQTWRTENNKQPPGEEAWWFAPVKLYFYIRKKKGSWMVLGEISVSRSLEYLWGSLSQEKRTLQTDSAKVDVLITVKNQKTSRDILHK